jgi:hypothetical protein
MSRVEGARCQRLIKTGRQGILRQAPRRCVAECRPSRANIRYASSWERRKRTKGMLTMCGRRWIRTNEQAK